MPVSCAYPGCFNIKRPKRTFSSGQTFLTFHRFPTHNPERLKLVARARVCSDHFFEDDFKPSQQGHRRYLKASAVPSTFLQQTEVCMKTPSSSGIYFAQPAIHSNQTPPVYNQPEQMEEQLEESLVLDVSLLSIEPQSDKKDISFQPLSSTSTSTTNSEEEECEMHWKQKKWIVNEPNVMELFKRCQECGSVITKTAKATVGSVLRVHWECEKKHKGKWSSCSDVRGMPANNLLVSALFATIYGIALQLVEATLT
uniref:THAP-type domain-containing protein n=1 Tax=Cyprinus carpio carpio TaxID=630221 RepID=A0A8C1HX40_CYPCA